MPAFGFLPCLGSMAWAPPRVKVYCPRTVRWQRAGYLPYGVGAPPVRPKNFSQEVPQRALVRRERGGCTVVFFLLLPFIRWQHRGQDREPSHCEQWQRTTYKLLALRVKFPPLRNLRTASKRCRFLISQQ